MTITIDRRTYDLADQERFAALSGDRNPVHLDPILARREIFGGVVVHGLHLALRALEGFLAVRPETAPVRLRAGFPNPAFLGAPVTTELDDESDERVRLSATSAGQLCLHLVVTSGATARASGADTPGVAPTGSPRAALVRSIESLAGCRGELDLWIDQRVAGAFPRLHARLGAMRMAQLLALTRLVGMECPGLHSTLAGFDLRFDTGEEAAGLRFEVERVVRAASFVRMRVAADGLGGTLDAFVRPPPCAQASFAAAQALVEPGELADQHALVVGGSRGLGEATAKLVAAGGGSVVVTYRTGRADAERVAAEITAGGGRCSVVACDAVAPAPLGTTLAAARVCPTHLYYFATPRIFVKRGGPFDEALRGRFAAVYVDGFAAVIAACRALGARPLRVFLPSSTAIEEPLESLAEYVAAKREAEARAAALAVEGDVEMLVRRLPRVATDQTLTVMRHPAASALDTMKPIVREMSRRHG